MPLHRIHVIHLLHRTVLNLGRLYNQVAMQRGNSLLYVGVDPCCGLERFPKTQYSCTRGAHFFMDYSELIRQLAEIQEKGFDDSFTVFCAETFASYNYRPEYLSAARMHALYLRLAMKMIMGESVFLPLPLLNECLTIAHECARDANGSGRSFCENFVMRWCARWSISPET